jgi:NADH-quinone oxidoreductase subunit G
MGADVHKLVPFGKGLRADMGQSRGAQSGEVDRHAVWLAARNLEPKLSPFDPEALLDEIQRLVPGYNFSRLNLFAGGDVHTHAPEQSSVAQPSSPESIVPAHDTLFTSGTLGRYSNTLNSVIENRRATPAEIPAD